MKAQLATCFILATTMLVANTASADKLPDPVTIEITSPIDGAMIEDAPAVIDVVVEVVGSADDIQLFVDDVPMGQIQAEAPWTFPDIALAEGMHTLQAIANLDGVGYGSPTVTVAVVPGAETGETGGEGTGTDGGSGGETTTSGTGTTSDGGGETGGSSGGCSVSGKAGGAGLLGLGLLGFAILGLTRRRA